MERSELQYSLRSMFVLIAGSSALFAGGRAFGVSFFLGLFAVIATLAIAFGARMFIPRASQIQIALLSSVLISAVISRFIDWPIWHAVAFTFALAMLVYYVAVWLGVEASVPLDAPVIGIPLIVVFVAVLWLAHFGPHGHARPVTLTMAVLAFAPFVASTFFNLFGLN